MSLFDPDMTLFDLIAYAASAFVLCSATTNNVLAFRLLSLASNLCFIAYAYTQGITPIFLLHAFLAPMNSMQVWRAWQDTRQKIELA